MSKILEKAQELGELLVNSKEYSTLEKVNNYFQSQKQFNQLMNSVNGEISNILNPDQGCSCGGNC
jgi:cell fate (sporulation/competence/biofilm development) regulator YlbF (YheA/YmcA/DUF963 family)